MDPGDYSFYLPTQMSREIIMNNLQEQQRIGWRVSAGVLKPTPEHMQVLSRKFQTYASHAMVKLKFRNPDHGVIEVLRSRIQAAGDTIQSLLRQTPPEDNPPSSQEIMLPAEDDLFTFRLIVDFLSAHPIHLTYLPLEQIHKTVIAAHRWDLFDLCASFRNFLQAYDKLDSADRFLSAKDVFMLDNCTASFRRYFWGKVGEYFPSLMLAGVHDGSPESRYVLPYDLNQVLAAKKPIEQWLCRGFPDLWSCAIKTRTSYDAVDEILSSNKLDTNVRHWLFDVVMIWMEPRTPQNDDVLHLLMRFKFETPTLRALLRREGFRQKCTDRALCLCKAVFPRAVSHKSVVQETVRSWKVTPSWFGSKTSCRHYWVGSELLPVALPVAGDRQAKNPGSSTQYDNQLSFTVWTKYDQPYTEVCFLFKWAAERRENLNNHKLVDDLPTLSDVTLKVFLALQRDDCECQYERCVHGKALGQAYYSIPVTQLRERMCALNISRHKIDEHLSSYGQNSELLLFLRITWGSGRVRQPQPAMFR